MLNYALTTSMALIIFTSAAESQEISFDIILANNVERGRNHYASVISEAERIISQCSGISAKVRSVRRFGEGSEIGLAAITEEITRQEARATVVANGGNVLIVNDLRVCGKLKEPRDGNIVGCAGPGTALTIETFEKPLDEGRTIAHELGHSVNLMWGIPPGDPHSPANNSLMYRALVPTVSTPSVSSPECKRFASIHKMFLQPAVDGGPDALILVDEADSVEISDEIPLVESDLDRFLETTWYGEIISPELDELMKAEDALSKVRATLVDGSSIIKRQNAATILGEYGKAPDIPLLQASLAMSNEGDDKAELQRFTSNVIGAVARLGVRHNNLEAVTVIQRIFAETVQEDASSLPVAGLTEVQRIDVMSSAATTVLEVSFELQDAGLITGPEALISEDSGPIKMQVGADSRLHIDPNLLSRVLESLE